MKFKGMKTHKWKDKKSMKRMCEKPFEFRWKIMKVQFRKKSRKCSAINRKREEKMTEPEEEKRQNDKGEGKRDPL